MSRSVVTEELVLRQLPLHLVVTEELALRQLPLHSVVTEELAPRRSLQCFV